MNLLDELVVGVGVRFFRGSLLLISYLSDRHLKMTPMFKYGSAEWTKFSMGAQFLIGGQMELDFKDRIKKLSEFFRTK